MFLFLLFSLLPLCFGDIMMYMHPVHPELHPASMYPIQKTSRGLGKVRDLPQSGIVYLKRIKPISDEFVKFAALDDETFVSDSSSEPLLPLSTEIKEQSVENKEEQTSSEQVTPTSFHIVAQKVTFSPEMLEVPEVPEFPKVPEIPEYPTLRPEPSTIAPDNSLPIFDPRDQEDLSAESVAALDNLLKAMSSKYDQGNEITFDDFDEKPTETVEELNEAVEQEEKIYDNIMDTKTGETFEKSPRQPKLITLSGTAKLHEGAAFGTAKPVKHSKPALKLVSLDGVSHGRHQVSRPVQNHGNGADFDPWERIGQRVSL